MVLAGHGMRGWPDVEVAVMGRRDRRAAPSDALVASSAPAVPDQVPTGTPAELRGVPSIRQAGRTTWSDRRDAVRDARRSTRSTRISELVDATALTAAAMVMDPTAFNAPAPNAVTRTWQHAAYGYVNTVPELNAARMYVGNALSRCTLAVGKRNPDGSVEQGYDGEEPVEGLDNAIAQEAADLISQIRSPRGGQSELLRSSGEKMFISGELYYVPMDSPTGGMEFDILSTQELLRDGATWTKYLGPGYGADPLPEGVTPVRVWRPDGQWSMLSTSSVRSCLEILEELVVLTRLVRSSAISRMALAGVLFVPDELDTPDNGEGPDGGESEAMNPLAVDMINTGAKAIDDPANASAWMPFIIQGPAEYGQHLRHIPFEASNEQQVIQRTEAIMRLARGLDLPVEVVTGHADTTFANAAQVNIDVFRIHLEPTLQLICDALTVAYLWPAMAKARHIDPEELAAGTVEMPEDILTVAVTYDAHHLVESARPHQGNAGDVHPRPHPNDHQDRGDARRLESGPPGGGGPVRGGGPRGRHPSHQDQGNHRRPAVGRRSRHRSDRPGRHPRRIGWRCPHRNHRHRGLAHADQVQSPPGQAAVVVPGGGRGGGHRVPVESNASAPSCAPRPEAPSAPHGRPSPTPNWPCTSDRPRSVPGSGARPMWWWPTN